MTGFLISLAGVLLSFSVMKFSNFFVLKTPIKYKHNIFVAIHSLYYVSEIIFTFGLFCIVIDNTILPLAYDENSYLKRFIDFFTVYQIGLFVILRIISNREVSSYRLLLSEIRRIRMSVEGELPLDDFYDEFEKESKNYSLHPSVRLLYKEIRLTLRFFKNSEKLFSLGAYDEPKYLESLKKFHASLTSKEILIEDRIIDIERGWDGSIILKLLRDKEIYKFRSSRDQELDELEELYLSKDE